jgi:L-lactate dehydrogenase complex protein LldF
MDQAHELSARTMDFSTLMKKLVEERSPTLKEGQHLGKFTYPDSCHIKRPLTVHEEPRELMRKASFELVEMFEFDMYCGMGGFYSIKMPEISAPTLQVKLRNIKDSSAPIVAMDCPCVMQIRGGFDKDGATVTVRQATDLLEEQFK